MTDSSSRTGDEPPPTRIAHGALTVPLALFAVTLALFAAASWWSYQRIESTVIADATAALDESGIPVLATTGTGLELDAEYRTLVIGGELPAGVESSELAALLLQVEAVRSVNLDGLGSTAPAPIDPPPDTTTTAPLNAPTTTVPTTTVPTTSVPTTTSAGSPVLALGLIVAYDGDQITALGPIGEDDAAWLRTVLDAVAPTNAGALVISPAATALDRPALEPLLRALPATRQARVVIIGTTLTIEASAATPLAQAQLAILAEQAGASSIDITLAPTGT